MGVTEAIDHVGALEAEVLALQERLRTTELKLEGIKQIGQILASISASTPCSRRSSNARPCSWAASARRCSS